MRPVVTWGIALTLTGIACGEDPEMRGRRIPPLDGTAADDGGRGGEKRGDSLSDGGEPAPPGEEAGRAGEASGGVSSGDGGVINGGALSGGASTGGAAMGGASTGGDSPGGAPTGGAPTGGGFPAAGFPGGGAAGSGDGGDVPTGGTPGAGGACGALVGDCGSCIAARCCAEVEACESVAACAASLETYYDCLAQSAASDGAGGVRMVDCGNRFEADADAGPGSEPEAKGLVRCIEQQCKDAAQCE